MQLEVTNYKSCSSRKMSKFSKPSLHIVKKVYDHQLTVARENELPIGKIVLTWGSGNLLLL